MSNELRIELPWPPAILSPNERPNRWDLAKAKKRYRHACATLTQEVTRCRRAPAVPMRVHLQFVPPTARERDEDNLVARMKAGLDGVAEALQIDDRLFRLEPPEISAPARTKGEAMVVLTMSIAEETNPRPRRTSRAADKQ